MTCMLFPSIAYRIELICSCVIITVTYTTMPSWQMEILLKLLDILQRGSMQGVAINVDIVYYVSTCVRLLYNSCI